MSSQPKTASSLQHRGVPTQSSSVLNRFPRDPSSQTPHDNPLQNIPRDTLLYAPSVRLLHGQLRVLGHAPRHASLVVSLSRSSARTRCLAGLAFRCQNCRAASHGDAAPSAVSSTSRSLGTSDPSRHPSTVLAYLLRPRRSTASENSNPGLLDRSPRTTLRSQQQPDSVRIFLHLDWVPGTAGTGNGDVVIPTHCEATVIPPMAFSVFDPPSRSASSAILD